MKNIAGLNASVATRFIRRTTMRRTARMSSGGAEQLVVAYIRKAPPRPDAHNRGGLWRYDDLLPIARADAVTLGEGGTPLLLLNRTAKSLGIARLLAKDETRNPTWSFKDRLASVAISVAKSLGASVIVSSSTGNAGAAAAAIGGGWSPVAMANQKQ